MNGINAIVINGKVYEAVEINDGDPCKSCYFRYKCEDSDLQDHCCDFVGNLSFRFSQSLTDKLNKE